jgi:class 3 adenylate cyclase
MRCSNCRINNSAGSRFCNQCGTPLPKTCPKCAVENARDAKFCSQCGAPLARPPEPVAESEPRERGLAGERRHLTVLFCDLVNSTSIAAQLDPEEWREIIADYQRAAAQAIERFGGHVANYLGDVVMAYFGWPEAHDNDAERAVSASLAILEALSQLNPSHSRPKLSARIGIDSGTVVIGQGAGKDTDVFGDAPNVAARVQAAAEAGSVLITDAVHRLVSGLFLVEDRGAPALKGVERPVQLYRVTQQSSVRGRLEAAAAARGLTPFIGREDELRSLMNRWERVLDGEGQVVLIVGEAGIGKSADSSYCNQSFMVTCLICDKKFSAVASECKCGAREFGNWLQQRPIFRNRNGHTPQSRLSLSTASVERSRLRAVPPVH